MERADQGVFERGKETMNSSSGPCDRIHILVTALGKVAKPTRYALGTRVVEAPLAPLVLVQLLDPSSRPTGVVALVTADAGEKTWPAFEAGIRKELGFQPQRVDIPDGRDAAHIREIVEKVGASIPEGADVTLDVTQGLRHFPFLFYAASLYLQSLRHVRIRGAYYGMIEGVPEGKPKPMVDLRPLLDLPEWFYAVRVFRETGSVKPMSELLKSIAQDSHERAASAGHDLQLHRQASAINGYCKILEDLAFAYESALPLELGRSANDFAAKAEKFPEAMGPATPFAAELAASLRETVSPLQLATILPNAGHWKTAVPLDQPELDRQARMIDLYLSRRQFPLAFGLMREWVISWCMLATGTASAWIDYRKRKPIERRLGALAAFLNPQNRPEGVEPSPEQKALGKFWHQVSDELRNAFHHHGMRPNAVTISEDRIEQVRGLWNDLRTGKVALPELGGGGGKSLITPQGTRPGVLYSALRATSPERCLVVCSPQSESTLAEAARKADFKGPIEKIIIQDPFSGFDELPERVKEHGRWMLGADEIVANLTGGTTLMGIAVQQLVEAAMKLDRPCRRFVLIDRRPPAEQERYPYVVGECRWIDRASGDNHDGDD
jgi:CRISPR-associated DxTHG motif protein